MWLSDILVASFCFGAANYIRSTKLLRNGTGNVLSPIQMIHVLIVVQAVLGALCIKLFGFERPPVKELCILLGVGVTYVTYVLFVFYALRVSDLTVIGPLFPISFIPTLLIGWFWLGETLTLGDAVTCGFMIAATVAFAQGKRRAQRQVVVLMLFNALFFGLNACQIRWLKGCRFTTPEIFAWSRVMLVPVLVFLFPLFAWHVFLPVVRLPFKRKVLIGTSEFLNGFGILFMIQAFLCSRPTALVNTVVNCGVVLAFVVAGMIAARNIQWYRDEVMVNLGWKTIGVILMLSGLVMQLV
ncbi:MAG: EamA family transporter [Nanoarchaeota archaeon]|nr:EamA family transporter [Nanoarchaeota archaeon]